MGSLIIVKVQRKINLLPINYFLFGRVNKSADSDLARYRAENGSGSAKWFWGVAEEGAGWLW